MLIFPSLGLSFSCRTGLVWSQLWNIVEKILILFSLLFTFEQYCIILPHWHESTNGVFLEFVKWANLSCDFDFRIPHPVPQYAFHYASGTEKVIIFYFFVTVSGSKELFQSAWPISWLWQKTFIDIKQEWTVLCCL